MHLRADRKIRVEAGRAVARELVGELTWIVHAADRHFVGERGDAADVIAVVVTDDHVVDAIDPGLLHRGHDAIRITSGRIRQVAGIDQQRLPGAENPVGGRHDQDRLSALGVDEVDLQVPGGWTGTRTWGGVCCLPVSGRSRRVRPSPRLPALFCASCPPLGSDHHQYVNRNPSCAIRG